MATEKYEYFKKNIDKRYISGEDLQNGEKIGKGLRPEMVVTIVSFQDNETFDQNNNKTVTKTGFNLAEYPSGKLLYKPVILNNTNADFCYREFQSDNLYDYIGKPLVLWAMPDRRHGHVARFKKYYPPASVSDVEALAKLNGCKTLVELTHVYTTLSAAEKKLPGVLALKDSLKTKLV